MKKKMKSAAKNTVGFGLIIIGCIMIVTPGPGLFTILAGLYISSFPGKPRLVNRLKRTRFYSKYLIHVELKLKSKFKRKENKKE